MLARRYRAPFWRRQKPALHYDIARLRPSRLKSGDRFEAAEDTQIESERSEFVLRQGQRVGRDLALSLRSCRQLQHRCDQTFCPLCTRVFRRWFIGELLRLTDSEPGSVSLFTVLLERAERDKIDKLDPDRYRSILRQRLIRSGLGNAVVIGGFENVYRARQKEWMLHINLVIIGGESAAIDKFQKSFDKSEIERPSMKASLNDSSRQLSYVLKFTTYHRPHQRRGSVKGDAKPLNVPEHLALVQWMAKRPFKKFMFLFNARQAVNSIVAKRNGD